MSEQNKTLQCEFKIQKAESHGDLGYIEGYASTFGNIDLGDDIVEKGAFSKTIKDKNGRWPILLDHDQTKQIGWNVDAREDDHGLFVKGEIQLITDEAKNRYALAKRASELGAKSGLSIGYQAVKSSWDTVNKSVRRLKELKLREYSFVTFPMNEEAAVLAAKASKNAHTAALVALIQKHDYDLKKVIEALAEQEKGLLPTQAAAPEVDPEIFQSMDKLIQSLRG